MTPFRWIQRIGCVPAALGLLLLAASSEPLRAQVDDDEESSPELVQALILQRALRFLEWPADAGLAKDAPLRITVLGESPLAARLRQVSARSGAGGRRFDVHTIERLQGPPVGQILIVTSAFSGELQQILALLRGKPILCVAESPGFARRGVPLAVYPEGGRIHLELNQAALSDSKIVASFQLLSFAELVESKQ